jgi:hypothetical protein
VTAAPPANGPVLEIAQPTLIELRCALTHGGAANAAVATPIEPMTLRREIPLI